MPPPDTKERLLDAAEALFAREGFHNTSLRAITGRAGVNLAAVSYHFGSKEALLGAVLDRRLEPLNALRRSNLEAVAARAAAQGRPPAAAAVLGAFIEPTLRFRDSGPGAEALIALIGRMPVEPDATLRDMFIGRMAPLFLQLFALLQAALPTLDEKTLFWRLQFAIGALGHTMCWAGRFAELPPELAAPSCDTEELVAMLLAFVAAGMEVPCTRPDA